MKVLKQSVVAVVLLAAAPITQAADFSYNYAEIAVGQYSPITGNTGTGTGLFASYSIGKKMYLVGKYDSAAISGVTVSDTEAGIGFHMPVGNSADFLVEVRYRTITGDVANRTGITGIVGMRYAVSEKTELKVTGGESFAAANFMTTVRGKIYDVAMAYRFKDHLGLNISYQTDPGTIQWSAARVGLRYAF